MCYPTLMYYEYHTVSWAEWLESVRKDVERLFGALKMRFRWMSTRKNLGTPLPLSTTGLNLGTNVSTP